MLPEKLLREDETVILAIKPSAWLIVFFSFRTVLIAGLAVAAAIPLAGIFEMFTYGPHIVYIAQAIALGRVGFAVLQWLSRTYVLTDQRVIRVRGVFTVDIFEADLTRIQNTFMVLTFPQRILGLGNIAFTTAGTGLVEAVWRHTRKPLEVHHQIIDALRRATTQPPATP